MAIDYDKLLALKIPDAEHTYGDKDTMLYALGVGLGHDPTDRAQLDFVYEKNLKALPTYACLLGYPGFWVRDLDTGIDWVKIVNGERRTDRDGHADDVLPRRWRLRRSAARKPAVA